jgi:putative transposase
MILLDSPGQWPCELQWIMSDTIEPVAKEKDRRAAQADQQLAVELVERARAEGVNLVGPGGLLTGLTKTVLETALEVELSDHLGYDKHDPSGRNGDNSRNGSRPKTVLTELCPVELEVPLDRDGTFEPAIVRKRQRRLDSIDEIVLPLTARGLTTRGGLGTLRRGLRRQRQQGHRLSNHRQGGRGDDRVARPAAGNRRVYPVALIDAIVVKARDGHVVNRPVYAAIGVTVNGERDILGLCAGDGSEGAKFWLSGRARKFVGGSGPGGGFAEVEAAGQVEGVLAGTDG